MGTHKDKSQEPTRKSTVHPDSATKGRAIPAFHLTDHRPESVAQQKRQEMMDNSPQAKKTAQLQALANHFMVTSTEMPAKEAGTLTAKSRQQPANQQLIQAKFWEMRPDGYYIWHEEDPDETWNPIGKFYNNNKGLQGWVYVFNGGQIPMDMDEEDLAPEYASSEQYYKDHPKRQTESTLSPHLEKDFRPIMLNDCAVGVKVVPVQGGGQSHTNWTEVMSINQGGGDGLVLTPTLHTEVKCLCSKVIILGIDIGDARQMTRYNISSKKEGDHTVSWKLLRASLGGFADGTVENCITGIFKMVDQLNTTSNQTPQCLMMCRSMLQGYDPVYLTT